jgi:hypothetical protein
MSRAGIMLAVGEQPEGFFCSDDGVSRVIEGLEYTQGEVPCVGAHRSGLGRV